MDSSALFLSIFCIHVHAQEEAQSHSNFVQKVSPQGFDNHDWGVFYYNGKSVYNLRSFEICSGDSIDNIHVNPSYTSFAVLRHNKKGNTNVGVYSAERGDDLIRKYQLKNIPITAIAYSIDAKQLAMASSDRTIMVYNAVTYEPVPIKTYTSSLVPSKMVYSDNGYFLVASDGNALEIWNLERSSVRTTITPGSKVNDFFFCDNSSLLLVLTNNGKMNVYDTKTFTMQQTIDDLGGAVTGYPCTDGKYVAILNSDTRISIINLLDPTERQFFNDTTGGTTTVRMVYDNVEKKPFLLYNTTEGISYSCVDGLTPHYNRMMASMLTEQMNQWMKQMPEETLEAYQARVNNDTRAEYYKEKERELATQMATGLLESSDVTIGNYNIAQKTLALHFNTMPDIFLDVPSEDVNAFSDASKLEFSNAKYSLNADDKFELVYTEVYNPQNGKTYVFNNLERLSLTSLANDDNFVPLEIVQMSNMEETALINIKDDVLETAKQEQTVTDKTHISVKAEAQPAFNAAGEKIVNYNVEYTYEVEEEYSARDDFKPGLYHVEESKAAMLMLKIMTKAFENDFNKYMVEGKRVLIKVKGTADASPINRALTYDGKYGEYAGEPVYKNMELSNINLNKKEGIGDNEQLAFARALGVKNFIDREIKGFASMETDYQYHIEVSKEEGSKYRRISVVYTFIDAF